MNDYDFECEWQYDKPDMIIGSKNKIKGDIKFEGTLRIDGNIEGRIIAPKESRVIISPGGHYVGDLTGLTAAFIDGKVIGDVNVEYLHLGSSASIHGDITCKSLQIDGGAALVGKLEISPHAMVSSEYDENKSIIDGDLDHEKDEFPLEDTNESPRNDDFGNEEASERNSPEKPPPRREYRVVLFIMEPQVDFYPGGKCGCKGASDDTEAAERLADFIHAHMEDIDEIVVSLDSHNRIHVAHGAFWVDKYGNSPAVNTLITMQDLQAGLWRPRKDESMDYCIAILQQLEGNQQLYGHRSINTGGEGGIVIKPDHCLVGSTGASILPVLHDAVGDWGAFTLRNVTYLTRDLTHEGGGHQHLNKAFSSSGSSLAKRGGEIGNSFAQAAVGDHVQMSDVNSPHHHRVVHDYYDLSFLAHLNEEDKLLICGQSHSLCVEFSLKDVLATAATIGNIHPENICILKDATSTAALSSCDVPEDEGEDSGYSGRGGSGGDGLLVEDFWNALSRTGVQITNTLEALL